MVELRSREWSPKQYTVSSNEDEENNIPEEALGLSNDMKDYNSEDDYEEHNNRNVLRDIVNEDTENMAFNSDSDDEEGYPQQDNYVDCEDEEEKENQ